MRQNSGIPYLHIGKNPDEHARRSRHGGGSRKDEQRPVAHAAHDNAPDLRHAVRRQLERKRHRLPAQNRCRENARHEQRQANTCRDDAGQHQRAACRAAREEHRAQENKQRKPSVARRKAVGEDGNQPLPRRVDDAAATYAAGVAPEAHAHGQALLAARSRALEGVVKLKRHARQVACVLEQREQREKDRHRRQHDRDHGCQYAPQSVGQHRDEKRRQSQLRKRTRKRRAECQKMRAQPLARHVCAE